MLNKTNKHLSFLPQNITMESYSRRAEIRIPSVRTVRRILKPLVEQRLAKSELKELDAQQRAFIIFKVIETAIRAGTKTHTEIADALLLLYCYTAETQEIIIDKNLITGYKASNKSHPLSTVQQEIFDRILNNPLLDAMDLKCNGIKEHLQDYMMNSEIFGFIFRNAFRPTEHQKPEQKGRKTYADGFNFSPNKQVNVKLDVDELGYLKRMSKYDDPDAGQSYERENAQTTKRQKGDYKHDLKETKLFFARCTSSVSKPLSFFKCQGYVGIHQIQNDTELNSRKFSTLHLNWRAAKCFKEKNIGADHPLFAYACATYALYNAKRMLYKKLFDAFSRNFGFCIDDRIKKRSTRQITTRQLLGNILCYEGPMFWMGIVDKGAQDLSRREIELFSSNEYVHQKLSHLFSSMLLIKLRFLPELFSDGSGRREIHINILRKVISSMKTIHDIHVNKNQSIKNKEPGKRTAPATPLIEAVIDSWMLFPYVFRDLSISILELPRQTEIMGVFKNSLPLALYTLGYISENTLFRHLNLQSKNGYTAKQLISLKKEFLRARRKLKGYVRTEIEPMDFSNQPKYKQLLSKKIVEACNTILKFETHKINKAIAQKREEEERFLQKKRRRPTKKGKMLATTDLQFTALLRNKIFIADYLHITERKKIRIAQILGNYKRKGITKKLVKVRYFDFELTKDGLISKRTITTMKNPGDVRALIEKERWIYYGTIKRLHFEEAPSNNQLTNFIIDQLIARE